MSNKKLIYDEFGIVSADFVNIDLANDNELFLNPYNIGRLDHPVAQKATEVAVHFFEQVRQELLAGRVARAKALFCNRLTEPKELCFGYAQKGIDGKGIRDLAEYIIDEIYYENSHLINEIKSIEDIKLYIDNIGNDRVSDIYANVIRGVLLEYTKMQCKEHHIPLTFKASNEFWDTTSSSWISTYGLEFVWEGDGRVKLFVPKCFIKGAAYTCSKLTGKVILSEMAREELQNQNSPLIRKRKDDSLYVTKKDIRKQLKIRHISLNKEFAREYAKTHQGCTERLRTEMDKPKKKVTA